MRRITIRGVSTEAFHKLGEFAREPIREVVGGWAGMEPIRRLAAEPRAAERLASVRAASEGQYPEVWAELAAMAAGAGVAVDELALLNFRGDIGVSVADENCSDLAWRRERSFLAHNEDDDPFFADRSALLTMALDGLPVVTGFWKYGFLPSNAFAFTDSGLVWSIDHMMVADPVPGSAGRHFVARELQRSARTIDDMLRCLREHPSAGGYAYNIGDRSGRVVVAETAAGQFASREAGPEQPLIWHTNHSRFLDGARPRGGGTTAQRGAVLAALPRSADEPDPSWFIHVLTGAPVPDGVRADPGGPTPSVTLCTFVADLVVGTVTFIERGREPVIVDLGELVAAGRE